MKLWSFPSESYVVHPVFWKYPDFFIMDRHLLPHYGVAGKGI
jgi:hypothetical protein